MDWRLLGGRVLLAVKELRAAVLVTLLKSANGRRNFCGTFPSPAHAAISSLAALLSTGLPSVSTSSLELAFTGIGIVIERICFGTNTNGIFLS